MDIISAIAGALLSLVFSYVPGAKSWFDSLDGAHKRLVMLGMLALAAVLVMGLACSGLAGDFGVQATCDRSGIVALIRVFIAAAIANQTTFLLSPQVVAPAEPVYEDLQ